VHCRREGDIDAGHLGDLRAPESRRDDDLVGRDGSAVGLDRLDGPVVDVQVEHLRVRGDGQPAGSVLGCLLGTAVGFNVDLVRIDRFRVNLAGGNRVRPCPHDFACPEWVTGPCTLAVEPGLDDVGVDVRDVFLDFFGGEQLGLLAPGLRRLHPAVEFRDALFGPGDLDTAAVGERVHFLVLLDAPAREVCHLPGVLDGHQEVRRVARRSTRVGERPLVQENDVLSSFPCEVIRQGVPDDSGSDDDRLGRRRQFLRTHCRPPSPVPFQSLPARCLKKTPVVTADSRMVGIRLDRSTINMNGAMRRYLY